LLALTVPVTAQWTTQTIDNPHSGNVSTLGARVVADNGTVVVSSPLGHMSEGDRCGFVRVYTLNGTGVATQQAELHASTPRADARFGMGVAISGDYMAVGAWPSETAQVRSGNVHVFARIDGQWSVETVLTAPANPAIDGFGYAVAIAGDLLAVGDPVVEDDVRPSGRVHLYRRSSGVWQPESIVTPPAANASPSFGSALAYDGQRLVVGSPDDDTRQEGTPSGSVFVYTREGKDWSEPQILYPASGNSAGSFGQAVCLNGEWIAAGDPTHSTAPNGLGRVLLFHSKGAAWTFEQEIVSPNDNVGSLFGNAIALLGQNLAIADSAHDSNGESAGNAYTFIDKNGTWEFESEIVPSDVGGGSNFGTAVAMTGNFLICSAPRDILSLHEVGRCHIFAHGTGDWFRQGFIQTGEHAKDDFFGTSLAVSNEYIVVGSPRDDEQGYVAGAVFLYDRDDPAGVPPHRLDSGPLPDYAVFGSAVDIDGDRIAVGAYEYEDQGNSDGAVVIFDKVGAEWERTQTILPELNGARRFGNAVALNGDRLAIGAYLTSQSSGSGPGSAHVYVRNGATWQSEFAVRSPDGGVDVEFGYSIGLSGDVMVVGAPQNNNSSNVRTGAAFVFTREGGSWVQLVRLTPEGGAAGDRFGYSVAIDGDTILVGSLMEGAGALFHGAAYAYRRIEGTWTLEARLVPSDVGGADQFGAAVALQGDDAVIGANFHSAAFLRQGAAHLYRRTGSSWSNEGRLLYSDPAIRDYFGASVAIWNGMAVIGAPEADSPELNSGAVVAVTFREIESPEGLLIR